MSLFDEMKNSVVSFGKDISKSAKDTTDIAKIKMEIKKKENANDELYMAIGKAYYEAHKNDAECEYPQVAEITANLADIEAYGVQANEIKGFATCPNCGAQVNPGAVFCGSCGNKMNN